MAMYGGIAAGRGKGGREEEGSKSWTAATQDGSSTGRRRRGTAAARDVGRHCLSLPVSRQ
jgi:hypothetical protein